MNYNRLFTNNSKKILVIGDIMLDIYKYGNCHRISPEAPVPVIELIKEEIMLGGAGNLLKNLVSLGAKCDIISVIGDDKPGEIVLKKIKELKINNKEIIVDKSRCTSEKCRIVVAGQQLIRIDKEDRHLIKDDIEKKIIKYVKDNIEIYDIIIFSDYLKGILTDKTCYDIIKIAKTNHVFTLVDPKGSNYLKYRNIDLIKPNLKEAEILLDSKIQTEKDLKEACVSLKKMLKCKYIVITLADKGMALLGDSFHVLSTKTLQVYDVSGAGDTVLASLAICLKQKYTLIDACRFANKAASIVISKFGSSVTTLKEVINLK